MGTGEVSAHKSSLYKLTAQTDRHVLNETGRQQDGGVSPALTFEINMDQEKKKKKRERT